MSFWKPSLKRGRYKKQLEQAREEIIEERKRNQKEIQELTEKLYHESDEVVAKLKQTLVNIENQSSPKPNPPPG